MANLKIREEDGKVYNISEFKSVEPTVVDKIEFTLIPIKYIVISEVTVGDFREHVVTDIQWDKKYEVHSIFLWNFMDI